MRWPSRRSTAGSAALAPAGSSDAISASDGSTDEWKALWRRLITFGIVLLGIALDATFIAAWIGLHQMAQGVYTRLGELPGMEKVVAEILKQLLTWSTLILVVAYVVYDVYRGVRRIWSSS